MVHPYFEDFLGTDHLAIIGDDLPHSPIAGCRRKCVGTLHQQVHPSGNLVALLREVHDQSRYRSLRTIAVSVSFGDGGGEAAGVQVRPACWRARSNTASSISGVTRLVNVFCWLG